MRFFLPLLAVLLCLSGCVGNQEERLYSDKGFSFVCPAGWRIHEESYQGARFIECSSGDASFNAKWVDKELDLNESVRKEEADLSELALAARQPAPEFLPPLDATFKSYEAVTRTYYTLEEGGGRKTRNEAISFNCNGKHFTLVFGGPADFYYGAATEFRYITESFECR